MLFLNVLKAAVVRWMLCLCVCFLSGLVYTCPWQRWNWRKGWDRSETNTHKQGYEGSMGMLSELSPGGSENSWWRRMCAHCVPRRPFQTSPSVWSRMDYNDRVWRMECVCSCVCDRVCVIVHLHACLSVYVSLRISQGGPMPAEETEQHSLHQQPNLMEKY